MSTIDGVNVHVEGTGDTAIVMVHGWPDTWRMWEPQVAAFRDRYRCVRFSLPGFEPGSARAAHSLDEIVALLRDIVDEVSPDRPVILMLHDWGCVFGTQYYAAHPDRVSRIVMVDIGDPRTLLGAWGPRELFLVGAYQSVLAAAWVVGGRAGDVMTRAMARVLRFPGDRALVHAGMDYPYFIQLTGRHGSYRRLTPFAPTCPVYFAYGRRKPLQFFAPAWADTLAKSPANRVVAYDTGHWVTVEAAEEFNRSVLEWLGG
jgi:pimeloyl-ACP methyl ester carboxylesterase